MLGGRTPRKGKFTGNETTMTGIETFSWKNGVDSQVFSGCSGEFDTHLLLNALNPFEYLFKHGLIDTGQMFGIDEIIRFAVLFRNRGYLPDKSQVHQITIGLDDIVILLF